MVWVPRKTAVEHDLFAPRLSSYWRPRDTQDVGDSFGRTKWTIKEPGNGTLGILLRKDRRKKILRTWRLKSASEVVKRGNKSDSTVGKS